MIFSLLCVIQSAVSVMLDCSAQRPKMTCLAVGAALCLIVPGLPFAKAVSDSSAWHPITVHHGDSLSRIFAREHLPESAWRTVLGLGGDTDVLKQLQTGDTVAVRKNASGRLSGLRYELDDGSTLLVDRVDGILQVDRKKPRTQMRKQLAAGKVQHSLPKSLASAGVPPKVADELAQIYWPRLDPAKEIQPGDYFSVMYEARYQNGKRVASGPVIAARITSHGRTMNAFRAIGDEGRPAYYDASGDAYRSGISRQPVEYTRISSPFMLERMDPAVHFVHPHYGVDMAAPIGTPIHAAGDGRVTYVGWMRGYGRLVELRHADGYTTRYAHLHKFADKLDKGDYVDKGEVIGQVGSTGWSTGPHLLYEIRHHGVPHDPMVMALPSDPSMSDRRLALFKNRIQPMETRLNRPLIVSSRLSSWVSSRACGHSAQINARLALDPRDLARNGSLSGLLCPEHLPGAAQHAARVADALPAKRTLE